MDINQTDVNQTEPKQEQKTETKREPKQIEALRINLASPEVIRNWSYGEVLKPETINYRRLRPEKDGLFCEAIFGPTRDWQCYCGKYKNPRYKSIVCDKCGVEVTRSSVRRERMGHIELAAPVAHVWYSKRIPSYLGLILDISRRNLDRVLSYALYIVTHVDDEKRQNELKKLEDKISISEHELSDQLNNEIIDLKKTRDTKLREIDAQIENAKLQFDEKVAGLFAPAIEEGKRLERELTDRMGKSYKKPIIFSADGVEHVIVESDTKISSAHFTKMQEIVSQHTNSLEASLNAEKDEILKTLQMEKEAVRAKFDLASEEKRNLLLDQEELTKTENAKLRDELYELQPWTFLSESHYRELKSRWGHIFNADMGAEAFYDILKRIDINLLAESLWEEARTTKSKQKRKKATSRLKVVEAFRRSNNRPEWMILTVLPVIPPDLRPMVQLDGGRFATSDLNDLYRRVINRNNRLKRLLELGAPEVIVRNEKRMLQEAVDSLIDNSPTNRSMSRRGRRELRSLSDMLKGKKGRFRRNLLGKRVDYSGRSVIVVGPHLKLYQCGLPKSMALELYTPFVIAILIHKKLATNIKSAKKLIAKGKSEVWEALSEAIQERPVLLNRAPTLHRLGIQAFEPILIEGSAIQLHPLVTTAFNADFDGDQMPVHVPLSDKAVAEARELMLSTKNLLSPASGEPIISPGKDMALGVYYLTMEIDEKDHHKGDGRVFGDINEVLLAYQLGQVEIHTKIKLLVTTWFDNRRIQEIINEDREEHIKKPPFGKVNLRLKSPKKEIIDTTVGRAIFNDILPDKSRFINFPLDKNGIKGLIETIYDIDGEYATTIVADAIKDIGFRYATQSGITLAVSDIDIPDEKPVILKDALEHVEKNIEAFYHRGLLTENEEEKLIIKHWENIKDKISDIVIKKLKPMNNLTVMAVSGATKGGNDTITQMAGMRGLVGDPTGRLVPMPIQSNLREGMDALEYFISIHGSRKGLADTALRTAEAGYLTRRLVDIAQDVIINSEDCGSKDGIYIYAIEKGVARERPFRERLRGRVTAERVINPDTGEVVAERDTYISKELARIIGETSNEKVKVRSALTCELVNGICAKCYGEDLGRGTMVELGGAVGIVAAQSIGEPGTQLTLRTFHTGGVTGAFDITSGLPRVEELFEARSKPKGEAVVTEIKGIAYIIEKSEKQPDQKAVRIEYDHTVEEPYEILEGWNILVKTGDEVDSGTILAEKDGATVQAANGGLVSISNNVVTIRYQVKQNEIYDIPSTSEIAVKDGQAVNAGEALTKGSLNPHQLLKIKGREETQAYLLREIQNVYLAGGQTINDKHFEVIFRKMLNKVQITRPGDSDFLPQDLVDRLEIRKINEALTAAGKKPAKYVEVLLGITKASLNTDSFLSAASFQHTIKVLAGAAIASKEDPLYGLKENVIIGKLIPAGTGFKPGRFEQNNGDGSKADTDLELEQSELFDENFVDDGPDFDFDNEANDDEEYIEDDEFDIESDNENEEEEDLKNFDDEDQDDWDDEIEDDEFNDEDDN